MFGLFLPGLWLLAVLGPDSGGAVGVALAELNRMLNRLQR